jgi:Rrp15p
MSRPASRRQSAKVARSKKTALLENDNDDGRGDQSEAVNDVNTSEGNQYPIHQSDDENEGSVEQEDDENSAHGDNDEDSDENDDHTEKSGLYEETDEYPRLESQNGEDSMEEEEHDVQLTTGMANAMARILGGALPSTKPLATVTRPAAPVPVSEKPIVLSKTKTPLQVQAAKEEKERRELLETRRLHREKRQVTALHIPLSVATARIIGDTSSSNNSVAVELEQERMHRRVATRGIVVLFNAIATHQANPAQTAVAAASVATKTTDTSKATKLTKHGFLDLIKQTAAAKVTAASAALRDSASRNGTDPPPRQTADGKDQRQWNALKDDYMLDSKKNWDEEEDEDEDESLTAERPAPKKKRHKTRN